MPTICGLCSQNESKYKCPTCLIPYCSLVCYKPHKAEHLASPPPPAPPPPEPEPETAPALDPTSSSAPPTSNTATEQPPHKFAHLLSDPTIVAMFRDETLRNELLRVYEATQDHQGRANSTAEKRDARATRILGAMRREGGVVGEWADYVGAKITAKEEEEKEKEEREMETEGR